MLDSTRDFFNTLSKVLLRCWLFGFLLLLIWLIIVLVLGETIRKVHAPLFGLSGHELDVIFYCGMGLLKLLVLICFFVPWLSIKLVLRKGRV
ncbi:MAG: DUF6868 family protein [Pirellulales bacterium]